MSLNHEPKDIIFENIVFRITHTKKRKVSDFMAKRKTSTNLLIHSFLPQKLSTICALSNIFTID